MACTDDSVRELFFSPLNEEALQRGMRVKVLESTDGRLHIPPQNRSRLRQVMSEVFDTYAVHRDDVPAVTQVIRLNTVLLDAVVPDIVSAAESHDAYLHTVYAPPQFADRGAYTSTSGTKLEGNRIFLD